MIKREGSDERARFRESLGQPRLEYAVNMARWPEAMRASFVELGPDATLLEYFEREFRFAMGDYDANALLDYTRCISCPLG